MDRKMNDTPFLATWLQQNFVCDPADKDGIPVEAMLFAFNEQSTATLRLVFFNKLLRSIFPSIEVVRRLNKERKFHITYIRGLKWLPVPVEKIELAFSRRSLIDIVPPAYAISQLKTDELSIQVPCSDLLQDSMTVVKTITLLANSTWTLSIYGKGVDLDSLHIYSKYTFSEQGIQHVVQIVEKLQPCQGKKVDSRVKVNTCSVHQISTSDASIKTVRSPHCKGCLSLTSKSRTCVACLKTKTFPITKQAKSD